MYIIILFGVFLFIGMLMNTELNFVVVRNFFNGVMKYY